ncbi:MAG: hypothetical protein V4714_23025 [Bacteroidota bacterium]
MEAPLSSPSVYKPKSALKTIIGAGLLAGILDIIVPMVMYATSTGKSPLNVLRFIASGVFGSQAFGGGVPMAIWGLIFHFFIAYAFTVVFFFAYPKIRSISSGKVLTGVGYGVFVWLVMNLIVLPLANTPQATFNLWQAIKGILILMMAFGLPLSLIVHKYYEQKQ